DGEGRSLRRIADEGRVQDGGAARRAVGDRRGEGAYLVRARALTEGPHDRRHLERGACHVRTRVREGEVEASARRGIEAARRAARRAAAAAGGAAAAARRGARGGAPVGGGWSARRGAARREDHEEKCTGRSHVSAYAPGGFDLPIRSRSLTPRVTP